MPTPRVSAVSTRQVQASLIAQRASDAERRWLAVFPGRVRPPATTRLPGISLPESS